MYHKDNVSASFNTGRGVVRLAARGRATAARLHLPATSRRRGQGEPLDPVRPPAPKLEATAAATMAINETSGRFAVRMGRGSTGPGNAPPTWPTALHGRSSRRREAPVP